MSAMSRKETNLAEATQTAISRLPLWQQPFVWMMMLRPRRRSALYAKLRMDLLDDPRAVGICESIPLGSESFSETTTFSLDLETFELLIQLILEYLPQFMRLFSSIAVWFALFCLCLPASLSTAGPANRLPTNGLHQWAVPSHPATTDSSVASCAKHRANKATAQAVDSFCAARCQSATQGRYEFSPPPQFRYHARGGCGFGCGCE